MNSWLNENPVKTDKERGNMIEHFIKEILTCNCLILSRSGHSVQVPRQVVEQRRSQVTGAKRKAKPSILSR